MNLLEKLRKDLFISAFLFLIELLGGFISNSLALLSDADHILTDIFAIALNLIAAKISKRSSDSLINGLSLLRISAYIFYESYIRFLESQRIELNLMIAVSLVGLAGNLLMVFMLSKGHEDLNLKSA